MWSEEHNVLWGRGQHITPKTVPLLYVDCFKLKAIKTQKTQEKLYTSLTA